jgi:hypothetical protein
MEIVNTSRRWVLLLLTATVLAGVTVGCTHEMQVKNLTDYYVAKPTEGAPLDVAIAPFKGNDDQQSYFQAVVAGLRKHPHVRLVQLDYNPTAQYDSFNPSHVVSLEVTPSYKGEPTPNFFITFPGFLIFTCAWNGYHYQALVNTKITVSPAKAQVVAAGGAAQGTCKKVPTSFRLRHCDFQRGFWSGTGWWFPGFGLTNIVPGVIFGRYDKDATLPFHEKADATYGNYMAEQVVAMLEGCGAGKVQQTAAR